MTFFHSNRSIYEFTIRAFVPEVREQLRFDLVWCGTHHRTFFCR